MKEVEFVSDVILTMTHGISGKSQTQLDNLYQKYDKNFPAASVVATRFREAMDQIDTLYSDRIEDSVFRSDVHFYSLFVIFYEYLWGVDSELKRKKKKRLTRGFVSKLDKISEAIETEAVPMDVLDKADRVVIRHFWLISRPSAGNIGA